MLHNVIGVLVIGVVLGRETTTECDYEIPAHMVFDKPMRTIDAEVAYQDDREKMLEAFGPRNLSYLRSSNYRDSRQTTLSIEEYLQSSEEEEEEPTEHDDYDSGSRSIDKKVTVPFVSIWPGYTPFTFDFPTPGILAMRYTAENERKVEQIPIDDGRNETLQWDHLIHTPKMAVIDFDYTLTNFSTDLVYETFKPYEGNFPAAIDEKGYMFVPHDEIRTILTALRSKGVKTALLAKERYPLAVEQFVNYTNLRHLFDVVDVYPLDDSSEVSDYLKRISAKTKIPIRDMLYFDENFQSLQDAFKLGATPQRCYTGLTMKLVNLCLNQHNQFNIHGVLPHKLYTATGIPGFEKEEFEDSKQNPIYMTTMPAEEYKKEYDKHIAALNKQLRPGHPPFPRWTKWRD
ncbi:hypothetical protein M8J75_005598 [Diaphorina citri]|nr:hypothetical protein M8J75_005598 [Diaphorina citri]